MRNYSVFKDKQSIIKAWMLPVPPSTVYETSLHPPLSHGTIVHCLGSLVCKDFLGNGREMKLSTPRWFGLRLR